MLFISFASEDREAARALAQGLRDAGVPVWCTAIPGTIAKGKRPEHAVPEAIAKCSAFAVFTAREQLSDWILDEIAEARDRQRKEREFRIVPILGGDLDPRRLPITIKNFEAVRLSHDPREMQREHFAALVAELRELLPPPAPVPAASAPAVSAPAAAAPSQQVVRLPVQPPARSAEAPTASKRFVDMVRIEGGTFLMGSADGDRLGRRDEKPQHRVTVPSFELGRHAVTRAQWREVMGANSAPEDWSPDGSDGALPATNVDWADAKKFCDALSMRERLSGKQRYRLPSEAEWEYACRAGTESRYWSGDTEEDLERVGWFDENSEGRVHAVGKKPANPWGLFDMHGNVKEWCADSWHPNYSAAGRPDDGSPWIDGDSNARVVRGGGPQTRSGRVRSASRSWAPAHATRDVHVGFRVARSLAPDEDVPMSPAPNGPA